MNIVFENNKMFIERNSAGFGKKLIDVYTYGYWQMIVFYIPFFIPLACYKYSAFSYVRELVIRITPIITSPQ